MPRRGIFEEDGDARKGDVGGRYQGDLTSRGAKEFERTRTKLARLWLEVFGYSRSVSDADTIEYAMRGHAATVAYLKKRKAA